MGDIVDSDEMTGTRFFGDDGVEVSSGVVPTGGTLTTLLYGREISGKHFLLQVQLSRSFKDEGTAKPGSPGGKDAVEHVDPEGGAHHQVDLVADTHQVARLLLR